MLACSISCSINCEILGWFTCHNRIGKYSIWALVTSREMVTNLSQAQQTRCMEILLSWEVKWRWLKPYLASLMKEQGNCSPAFHGLGKDQNSMKDRDLFQVFGLVVWDFDRYAMASGVDIKTRTARLARGISSLTGSFGIQYPYSKDPKGTVLAFVKK